MNRQSNKETNENAVKLRNNMNLTPRQQTQSNWPKQNQQTKCPQSERADVSPPSKSPYQSISTQKPKARYNNWPKATYLKIAHKATDCQPMQTQSSEIEWTTTKGKANRVLKETINILTNQQTNELPDEDSKIKQTNDQRTNSPEINTNALTTKWTVPTIPPKKSKSEMAAWHNGCRKNHNGYRKNLLFCQQEA